MTAVNNGTEPGLQSDLFSDTDSARINAWAIIVAGGSGSRLSSCLSGQPKQFYIYKDAPLYWQSAKTLARCACIKGMVFVFPEEYCVREEERLIKLNQKENTGLPWKIVKGGGTRSESSRNGLYALPQECTHVFIHDAARPFINPELVWRLYKKISSDTAAVIPGLRLSDTVKTVDEFNIVMHTPSRSSLRAIQTPQLFSTGLLKKLYQETEKLSEEYTDDAMMLEKAGYKVEVIDGDSKNIKITNPDDLNLLKESECMIPCTGFGYDVHRFGEGHPLKLGGVPIPGPYKIVAHSDGDVLLHALTDAVLALGGFGDIGSHFPDTNAAYSDMASSVFLDHALSLVQGSGIKLTHLDLTLVTQKPKLVPYKKEIAKNVARLCNLDISRVNVKATTEEGLGFTGRLEGIKAYAIASALKKIV